MTNKEDLTQDPDFASQVFPVISKQWDGLSQSSKATVVELLSHRTTVPCRIGGGTQGSKTETRIEMRKPSQAYFPSVKLFDDLPLVIVNAVKEKFLVALGVRKTIELDLVFQRLLKPEKDSASAWSHVDLIKYLASVQTDIPKSDILKLQGRELCTAEGTVSGARFRVCDLYEPNAELRDLKFRMLHWPGTYRPGSPEGKFLKILGIRSTPTSTELINAVASASAENNIPLRERAIKYFCDYHHQHGYLASEISQAPVPFLPVEGDANSLSMPSKCYTNEKVSIMGFSVLRNDLRPYADKFGVKPNPREFWKFSVVRMY